MLSKKRPGKCCLKPMASELLLSQELFPEGEGDMPSAPGRKEAWSQAMASFYLCISDRAGILKALQVNL